VSARPDSAWYRIGRFASRYKLQVTAATIALFAIIGGGAAAVWQAHAAAQQRDRATALASRDGAINEFMYTLFIEAAASNKAVTVAEILERSEKLALADSGENSENRAAILAAVARLYIGSGEDSKGTKLVDRALSLLSHSGDNPLRSMLNCDRALLMADRGQIEAAIPLINGELELIFHLLEQVALALRNIWLHNQIAGNNEMMTDVLRELSSACIVVGSDLKVLHANRSAHRHFAQKNKRTNELEFSDLPHALGAKIYQVLKTGAAIGPFRYESENSPGTVYKINVVPFHSGNSAVPASALLTAEDLTQTEQLQKLEVEAEHLRLIKSMSGRLAHEIGNAMVALSAYQQLFAEKSGDKEFLKMLDGALSTGVTRVDRLINTMRFLERDSLLETQTFPVGKLIEDAYKDARKYQPAEAARLQYEKTGEPINLTGDRAALKHALSEIMLNALQANPKSPTVDVHLHTGPGKSGGQDLQIEVQDNGDGFSAEAAKKVPSAFYTTRIVGLGLGLTVSRKIIETHHGKLEIVPPQSGHAGVVRVSLPLDPAVSTAA